MSFPAKMSFPYGRLSTTTSARQSAAFAERRKQYNLDFAYDRVADTAYNVIRFEINAEKLSRDADELAKTPFLAGISTVGNGGQTVINVRELVAAINAAADFAVTSANADAKVASDNVTAARTYAAKAASDYAALAAINV